MMRGDERVGGVYRAHWPTRAGTKTSECVAQPHLIQFAAVSRLHPGSWNRCFEVGIMEMLMEPVVW